MKKIFTFLICLCFVTVATFANFPRPFSDAVDNSHATTEIVVKI